MESTQIDYLEPVTPATLSPVDWRGYAFVATAAVLWGTLGVLFKHVIGTYNLPSINLAFWRALLAFAFLFAGMAIFRPQLLRIKRRDLPLLAVIGLVSVAVFYAVYIAAIDLTTVATGVTLLYTAPAFVTLLAWRLYGESLTRRKLAALAMAFVGCALVARAYDPAQLRLNALGILSGLAAAFTYAMYSIFGKYALRRHNPWTLVVWIQGFGALFLLAVQSPESVRAVMTPTPLWFWLAVIALGPTVGSFSLYTLGLQHIEASRASIIATLEPVVGALLSFAILGERFAPLQALGGAMIIGGVILLSFRGARV